jgi:hypothetical protein
MTAPAAKSPGLKLNFKILETVTNFSLDQN